MRMHVPGNAPPSVASSTAPWRFSWGWHDLQHQLKPWSAGRRSTAHTTCRRLHCFPPTRKHYGSFFGGGGVVFSKLESRTLSMRN